MNLGALAASPRDAVHGSAPAARVLAFGKAPEPLAGALQRQMWPARVKAPAIDRQVRFS